MAETGHAMAKARHMDRLYEWEVRKDLISIPFPFKEYEGRVDRVRRLIADHDLDALIICGDVGHKGDVRWLTNYYPWVGNSYLCIAPAGEPVLVLQDDVPGFNLCRTWVRDIRPPTRGSDSLLVLRDTLISVMHDLGVRRRLGVVGETGLPTPVYQGFLADNPGLEFVDESFALVHLRAVKSPLEVEKIRRAVAVTDLAVNAMLAMIPSGATEKQVAAEGLRVILTEGDEIWDVPMVVAGPRASWKHAKPEDRPLGPGEPIYIDLTASVDGYMSDVSRTVLLGDPTPAQANALEFALVANAAVKEAARPGIPAKRLYEVAAAVAARFGLEGKAGGGGHGIGCKLREEPILSLTCELILQPGMTIAIEPMYVSDMGTFVVEDDILITETGSEYLSNSPRRNWK